jgi:hypothetical protein
LYFWMSAQIVKYPRQCSCCCFISCNKHDECICQHLKQQQKQQISSKDRILLVYTRNWVYIKVKKRMNWKSTSCVVNGGSWNASIMSTMSIVFDFKSVVVFRLFSIMSRMKLFNNSQLLSISGAKLIPIKRSL